MTENIFTTLESRVTAAERLFLTDQAGDTITYGALLQGARQYAQALTSLGAKPGDRIAVQTDKTVESLFLFFGTLAAGCVYLPLNTGYTAHEVQYFLQDAEPAVLICSTASLQELEPIATATSVRSVMTLDSGNRGTIIDLAARQPADFAPIDTRAESLAAILYTSGTTGLSKGAMLSHRNLLSNASTLIDAWRISPDDCLLHALPIYHTHGLFVGAETMALAGASMIYLPRFDATEIIRQLPAATMLMGVPTFYSRLLAEPSFNKALVSNMRVFISGSAPLSAQTHKDFQQRTGHAILERYGMTETNMNTSNPYDGNRRPGAVGMPLADVELRIADPATGQTLAAGEVGSIEVRGPNVFSGYWHNAEKTKSAFRADEFFITGDLGRVDADGYLWIVGRDKDLIITGGFNVYPAEVESEIDAIDGVAESAVIGAPHADFGEGVIAVVVQRADVTLSATDIIDVISKRLARFKIPKQVYFSDTLPRNTMGKVQKNVLRETYRETFTRECGSGTC
ncbi:MAG: malonate--CoA ligase [Alphaproteobacteria bacterium]